MVLTGDDLVATVLDYARRNNVTQIVIGKSRRRALARTAGPRRWPRPCCAEQRGAAPARRHRGHAARTRRPRRARPPRWRPHWWRPIGSPSLVAAATVAGGWSISHVERANLAMIFMAERAGGGLACSACGRPWRRRRWPSVVYNFFFLRAAADRSAIGHPDRRADLRGVLGRGPDHRRADRPGARPGPGDAQRRRLGGDRPCWPPAGGSPARRPARTAAKALAEQTRRRRPAARPWCCCRQGERHRRHAGAPTLEVLAAADMAAARWAWEKRRGGRRSAPAPCRRRRLDLLAAAGRARRGPAWSAVEAAGHGRGAEDERFAAGPAGPGRRGPGAGRVRRRGAPTTEALRRADRLRSALLNSVSHDLRTPLSTVLGSATHPDRLRQGADRGGPRRPAAARSARRPSG